MQYSPTPYVNWIKHLEDYRQDCDVFSVNGNAIEILVHPGHDPLRINSNEAVYQSVDKEDKTVQLYFYSLAWIVPVLVFGSEERIDAALGVVKNILDISPDEERSGAWNMLWDDHAICERLCVLLEIRKSFTEKILNHNYDKSINEHIEEISRRLNSILTDDRWKNNNHRIFHLLAAFVYAFELGDEKRKIELKQLIDCFVCSLIDQNTGFSLEQSIAYCFFDLVVVKKVLATMSQLSASLDISAELIETKLNRHMAALAFPDGSLPASGDTPHGKILSRFQKTLLDDQISLMSHWKRLDEVGYYRGCADDGSVHFLTLSHNAESAHGHSSPLHTDIWFKDFGFVLADSGGPYKYGSKLRYEWFRAARGHNSLSLKDKNQQILEDLSVGTVMNRSGLIGRAAFKTSCHNRALFAYKGRIIFHESISSKEEWELYYNFSEGCELKILDAGTFEIRKLGCQATVVLKTNVDPTCLKIIRTERCTGHSKSVSAPSLLVSSSASHCDYFIDFYKVS